MSDLALEPMLDFVIYPDGGSKAKEGMSFVEMLVSSKNSPVELSVYNLATQNTRKVLVTPKSWEGKGLLGIKARPEDYYTAPLRVLRVISYLQFSPLQRAGLIPLKDYILGTTEEVFADLDEFESFVKSHNRISVELLVYNSDTESIRTVLLQPNRHWGGQGYIGGDIGVGTMHAVPMRRELVRKPKTPEPVAPVAKSESAVAGQNGAPAAAAAPMLAQELRTKKDAVPAEGDTSGSVAKAVVGDVEKAAVPAAAEANSVGVNKVQESGGKEEKLPVLPLDVASGKEKTQPAKKHEWSLDESSSDDEIVKAVGEINKRFAALH